MLRLGEMANTVCCTAIDPTKEAYTSMKNGKGTRINTLTNSARAEQLHLLSILHERIKLYLPPHGKVRDEMQWQGKRFERPPHISKNTRIYGPDPLHVTIQFMLYT
ncbi:hypothetical protein AVEN_238707-1 [Araneus ventricosus]|uniref:Uncharacterized protein n=1 Tax=Araneus ventricosus TaxID=182803 RepID=A0A4Y2BW83_ARAVE|nr:hypothetical protein AVEN_238707-1 [Araneus ventricosus]